MEVAATLADCNFARRCGRGGRAIACMAPPLNMGALGHTFAVRPPYSHFARRCVARRSLVCSTTHVRQGGTARVPIAVSVNGHDFTSDGTVDGATHTFEYYDAQLWRADGIAPRGGSLDGGTPVALNAVTGVRLHSLGDARCIFGHVNAMVDATVAEGGGAFHCRAPPHWAAHVSTASVQVELTLNGQDSLVSDWPHLLSYTYCAPAFATNIPSRMPPF